MLRISSRNARFQQWEALLGNRTKRQRAGEFLVQGVRPITLAARFGWPFRALLYDDGRAPDDDQHEEALPRDHPVRTDNRARRRVRELISSEMSAGS